MSTVILGQIAKSPPAALEADDDKKHWVEAVAAIIPGEALLAATAVITAFTVKASDGAASLGHEWGVRILIGAIALLIPFVYAANAGHIFGGGHVIRWFAAIVAFAAWLWLLPLSVWDTFDRIADLDEAVRAAVGIVAALGVWAVSTFLFKKVPV